jgi:YidC/Oxa1 family membrane protein insertase
MINYIFKNSSAFFRKKKILALFIIFPLAVNASYSLNYNINNVKESNVFYGLAAYYNNVSYYVVDEKNITKLKVNEERKLKDSEWFAAVGRLNVYLIQGKNIVIGLDEYNQLSINDNQALASNENIIQISTTKDKLGSISPELNQIRYQHLWAPLSELSQIIELSLIFINKHISNNWGVTVILFAIIYKILILPVSIMTAKLARNVNQIRTQLEPKLTEIKSKYDGEEAHNKIMKAHSELGVSPFYSLKPMVGSFIQIPILIAVFNALGEMPQFSGESLFWIENLAYPDSIMHSTLTIPMFGNTLNLLPLLMAITAIYSTITYKNKYLTLNEVKKQKRKLYSMAVVFFILFYPFPAVMVLYWTLANILDFIERQYREA